MDLLNRWPKTTGLIAGGASILAIGFLIVHSIQSNQRPKGDLWFYDLKTKRLFSASDLSVPPIDTPSGSRTGVRAQVFSCGDCSEADRFIAYLEMLTPDGKRAVEAQMKGNGGQTGIGFALEKLPYAVLVRSPDNDAWYPQSSPEGQAVVETGRLKGGCAHPRPCVP